jgi:hypothetical protein
MREIEEIKQNNQHYSEQTGHFLRGAHSDVVKKLGGKMPESLPGFDGIDVTKAQMSRRQMRRITRDGRR